MLLAMKAAEDGSGIILRLAETRGRNVLLTIDLPHCEIANAFATDLVEANARRLESDRHSVRVTVPARGIVTVLCKSARPWPRTSALLHF